MEKAPFSKRAVEGKESDIFAKKCDFNYCIIENWFFPLFMSQVLQQSTAIASWNSGSAGSLWLTTFCLFKVILFLSGISNKPRKLSYFWRWSSWFSSIYYLHLSLTRLFEFWTRNFFINECILRVVVWIKYADFTLVSDLVCFVGVIFLDAN